jgi:orotate phosphoribosyltransferase
MSFDDTKRQRLAALLTEHSVKTGTFTLASGQTSDIYCDVKKTALLAEGAYLCGLGLYSLARQVSEDATGCGGLTLGADPLVTAMAIASHLEEQREYGAIIVRKETKDHGTQRAMEVPNTLSPGDRIVAVDDTVTTGGSTMKAIEALREAGYTVEHAVCVVDRGQGGQEKLAAAGVTLHALYSLDELRPE